MNRYARRPKPKKYDDELDDDDDDLDPEQDDDLPSIAQRQLIAIKPLGRPYKSDDEKKIVFHHLVRLKENRKTHEECAEILGVSIRTIVNYLVDPLYDELMQEVQHEAKERGHLLISDVIDDAVQKLYGLMHTAKSEFVQYKSAEYILKMAGYEIPKEQRERDNQADVIDFLSKLDGGRKARGQVNVQINNYDSKNAPQRQNGASIVEGDVLSSLLPETTSTRDVAPELERYMRPMLPGGKIPSDDDRDE